MARKYRKTLKPVYFTMWLVLIMIFMLPFIGESLPDRVVYVIQDHVSFMMDFWERICGPKLLPMFAGVLPMVGYTCAIMHTHNYIFDSDDVWEVRKWAMYNFFVRTLVMAPFWVSLGLGCEMEGVFLPTLLFIIGIAGIVPTALWWMQSVWQYGHAKEYTGALKRAGRGVYNNYTRRIQGGLLDIWRRWQTNSLFNETDTGNRD